jgi:hypothetical protein
MRLAPALISEVTRRVNREGIFQACYTAGKTIPRPVTSSLYVGGGGHSLAAPQRLLACCSQGMRTTHTRTPTHAPFPLHRYYHRSLNPKKLIEIRFSGLRRNEKLKDVIKRNRLPLVRTGNGAGGFCNGTRSLTPKPCPSWLSPSVLQDHETPGFRPMEEKDVDVCQPLLAEYLKK